MFRQMVSFNIQMLMSNKETLSNLWCVSKHECLVPYSQASIILQRCPILHVSILSSNCTVNNLNWSYRVPSWPCTGPQRHQWHWSFYRQPQSLCRPATWKKWTEVDSFNVRFISLFIVLWGRFIFPKFWTPILYFWIHPNVVQNAETD